MFRVRVLYLISIDLGCCRNYYAHASRVTMSLNFVHCVRGVTCITNTSIKSSVLSYEEIR